MPRFKTIPAYPRYSISAFGEVRNNLKGNILKWVDNGKGYKLVKLYNEQKPQGRLCLVHRLVLSTYLPTEGKFDVNHIDGDKSNNTLDNLEWVTKSANTVHAHKLGLFKHKLSDVQVLEIRQAKGKVPLQDLINKYNVSKSLIQQILYRKSYNYL